MADTGYRRGVNLVGADSGAGGSYSNVNLGTSDWPTDAYLTTLGSKVDTIRLPFKWERLQPVLGGPLATTELNHIKRILTTCAAARIKVILDLHNYAEYFTSGHVSNRIGGGVVTPDHLADFWSKMSAAVGPGTGYPALLAYDLMNEPNSMPSTRVGSPTHQATLHDFALGGSGLAGWNSAQATVSLSTTPPAGLGTNSGALKFTYPVGANGVNLSDGDTSTKTNTVSTAFWCYVYVAPNPNIDPAFKFKANLRIDPGDGGPTRNGGEYDLTPGQWNIIGFTTPLAQSYRSVGLAVSIPGDRIYSGVDVYVDSYYRGTGTFLSGREAWENTCKTVMAALRARGDNTRVMVPGYSYSVARDWAINHPDGPWIVQADQAATYPRAYADPASNFMYTAHEYLDGSAGGTLSGTYDSYYTGWTPLNPAWDKQTDHYVNVQLKPFADFLAAHNQRGFLGEWGVKSSARSGVDATEANKWVAHGEKVRDYLAGQDWWSTPWASSEYYPSTQAGDSPGYEMLIHGKVPHPGGTFTDFSPARVVNGFFSTYLAAPAPTPTTGSARFDNINVPPIALPPVTPPSTAPAGSARFDNINVVPTSALAPVSVSTLTVTPLNAGATVSWTHDGARVTSFAITATSGAFTRRYAVLPGVRSLALAGLINDLVWTISVAAVGVGGTSGVMFTTVTPTAVSGAGGTTNPTAQEPGAPHLATAVAGPQSLYATWTAPADDGGRELTSYAVTATATTIPVDALAAPTFTVNVPASQLFGVVTGMLNDLTYTVVVQAYTSVGASVVSNSLTVSPTAASPLILAAPITGLNADPLSRGAHLTWTQHAIGLGDFLGYVIQATSATTVVNYFTADQVGEVQLAGLTNDLLWTIGVAVRTSLGTNAYVTDTVTPTSDDDLPSADALVPITDAGAPTVTPPRVRTKAVQPLTQAFPVDRPFHPQNFGKTQAEVDARG